MLRLPGLLLLSAGLLISLNVLAQDTDANTTTTVVEKRTIITPAPVANCVKVDAHWENNVWVYAHDVCKYSNRTEGVAWIADYWSCTQATDDGKCTSWSLVPGHWVNTYP